MKKLKPTIKPGSTLVYDDLKGKLFRQLRVYQASSTTFLELIFEDQTSLVISLEPEPHVQLTMHEDHDGDLKPIAISESIPVPANE